MRTRSKHASHGSRPRPATVSLLAPASPTLDASALLSELGEAAERYVNKAPKQQRLAADRQALLDVLTRAQLYLSVQGATGKSTHR